MGRTGDRLTAGRKQVTVVTRSEHIQAGVRQGSRGTETPARSGRGQSRGDGAGVLERGWGAARAGGEAPGGVGSWGGGVGPP